jgi:hypothetical protein
MTSPLQDEVPDEGTVARYLSNRLDLARAEAFEAHCLRHPEFAQRVELDLRLRTGLQAITAANELRPAPRRDRLRTILAIAAGLIIVVAGAVMLLARWQAGTLIAYRVAADVPASLRAGAYIEVTLLRLREGPTTRRIVAPRRGGVLALRIFPDLPPGRLGYFARVAVDSRWSAKSVALGALHADAEGYVDLYLPLSSVIGQTLRVIVTPYPDTNAAPLSFGLQVAPAADKEDEGP